MKIKNIEWRNVASYGNKIQKLELPEKAGLIQVVGENGVGKSTISDVITFGLYGKLEGKKLKGQGRNIFVTEPCSRNSCCFATSMSRTRTGVQPRQLRRF